MLARLAVADSTCVVVLYSLIKYVDRVFMKFTEIELKLDIYSCSDIGY